jgi:acetyltransferase-like isoleucine patch superfamily enzyme
MKSISYGVRLSNAIENTIIYKYMGNRNYVYRNIENITPGFLKAITKRIYYKIIRLYWRCKYIKKGRFVEFGYRFRFERVKPYCAYIGERTITEDFNVWNANVGDIVIGKRCWIGLHNIIMGPVVIGDDFSTGPYVFILGPRHPVLKPEEGKTQKTIIGNNVWISTGSIILFGVTLGDNVVVSAGSVVTKDVPANSFVGGNPARDLSKITATIWKKTDK